MLKKFQKKLKYWLPRFFFQRKNLGSYYRLVCPSVRLSVRLSVRPVWQANGHEDEVGSD